MEYIFVATNQDVLLTEACYCSQLYGNSKNFFKIVTLIYLINMESTLADFEKFHPPQKSV